MGIMLLLLLYSPIYSSTCILAVIAVFFNETGLTVSQKWPGIKKGILLYNYYVHIK